MFSFSILICSRPFIEKITLSLVHSVENFVNIYKAVYARANV